jgi:hypothetical protein
LLPLRNAKSLGSVALGMFLSLLTVNLAGQPPSEGDGYTPPLTAWGHPDLQGVWNNNTNVPLERPDELEGRATLTDEEVAERRQALSEQSFGTTENRVDVGGTGFYQAFWNEPGLDLNRSSLLIDPADGRLPALTPEGERDRATGGPRVQRAPTDISDLSVYERCITRGLPGAMMPGFYNHNYQIVQTPEYVAILVEMIHDARIIPLDGRPHLSPEIHQWMGDSRGRWEGNTLVVETTHFPHTVSLRGLVRPHDFHLRGTNLRLVERFTRVSEDSIDYRFTVEDPRTYTDSWTVAIPMNRFDGTLFEYACHEGNYGMMNMLSGARAIELAGAQ